MRQLLAGVLAVTAITAAFACPCAAGEPSADPLRRLDSIQAASISADGRTVRVCVSATARTPGYTDLQLRPAADGPGEAATYQLEAVGRPPTDMVAQVLTPVTFTQTLRDLPEHTKSLRIAAMENSVDIKLGETSGACAPEATASQVPAPTSGLIGEWLAEDIDGAGVIDNAQSKIAIGADGRVSGSGGCNRLMGTADVGEGRLAFSLLAATRKMCAPALMDQEGKFIAALATVRSFTIEGSILHLLDADGRPRLRLSKMD